MRGGNILSLCARESDRALLLRPPADRAACEHEDEARRGLTIVHIAGPIGVDEPLQDGAVRRASLENELPVARGSKVAKHTIKSALVVGSGASRVSPECGNSVGQIRASPKHQIHKRTDGAL